MCLKILLYSVHIHVILQSVQMDPFLDDCVMFAKKLKKLGVAVSLDILDGLPHGFLNFSQVGGCCSKTHTSHSSFYILAIFCGFCYGSSQMPIRTRLNFNRFYISLALLVPRIHTSFSLEYLPDFAFCSFILRIICVKSCYWLIQDDVWQCCFTTVLCIP